MTVQHRIRRWLSGAGFQRQSPEFQTTLAHLQALGAADDRQRLVAQWGMQRVEGLPLAAGKVRLALNASFALNKGAAPLAVLKEAGLAFSAADGAFCRDMPVHTRTLQQRFVQAVEHLLGAVGGKPAGAPYSVALEHARDLANQDIRQAMRKLANLRDHQARTELYQRLLSASFYMPVQWHHEQLSIAHPEQLQGQAVWCVFSQGESFAQWLGAKGDDKANIGRVRVHMLQLLGWSLRQNIASLRINPGFAVGGELYRNELQTMAQAAGVALDNKPSVPLVDQR